MNAPDIDKMLETQRDLLVKAVGSDDPRDILTYKRYVVGLQLARYALMKMAHAEEVRMWAQGEKIGEAVRELRRFKERHPEIINPRTRQMRLSFD